MAKKSNQHFLLIRVELAFICFLLSFQIMSSYWGRIPNSCEQLSSHSYFLPCEDIVIYYLSVASVIFLLIPLLFIIDHRIKKPSGRIKNDSRMILSMAIGISFSIVAFLFVSDILGGIGIFATFGITALIAFLLNGHLLKRMDNK